jgi:predicted CXXCH cytochrome family protein
VHDPSPSPPSSRRGARWRWAAAAILILAGIAWAVRTAPWRAGRARGPAAARDVSADSPYLNARPGVAYVGDAECARCHVEIAAAYRGHPMGRSLAPVGGTGGSPVGAAAGLPFESKGVRYDVERRDGRVIHKASRKGPDGGPFAEVEAEVSYALGSGTRGIAYLIERDGFLFQSPIAWFAQEGHWGISPGFGEFATRPNFERLIPADCLFCHANQFRPVVGTVSRYETPIFRGHAIGCERCHGPGALHVGPGERSAGSELTIVNPADLAPPLRESVCQQCHLQGSYRFPRAGRGTLDYRPGLPLHRFLAVFLMKKGERGKFEAVGHVEQMESSRCFVAGGGELGCTSCHDPHRTPPAAEMAASYRGRCLECHERRGCALAAAERLARGPGEDCVACHMPRLTITNIPHTAATDHRIPRGTPGSAPEGPRVAPGQPADLPLADYHWGSMTADERRDAERDWGVALSQASRIMSAAPPLAKVAASKAVPRLEAAVRDRPDDLHAFESLGYALGTLGRREEALRAYEAVLRIEPHREMTHRATGRLLSELQRPGPARAALQEAIAVDPWRSDFRLALAEVCAQAGDWPAAVSACREAIRLNPELFEARSLLVRCYLRSREADKADAEFRTLVHLFPASREIWQQWYDRQKQAGAGAAVSTSDGQP